MRDDASPSGDRSAGPHGDGFERYTVSLIVVSGPLTGEEHVVERPRWVIGRGPGVDAAFTDPEMSQHHLRIEFERGRFQVIDLDSTNGTRVNGTGISSAELAHGDRIQAGAQVFQILIEKNARTWQGRSASGDVVPRIQ